MTGVIRSFFRSEYGAVTVDWVVLTALVLGLIAVAFAGIDGGVANATAAIIEFFDNIIIEI